MDIQKIQKALRDKRIDGWLLCDFSGPRLGCWLALLPVLVLKAAREERLLGAKFPDYAAYRAATWRFIPWVW